MLLASQLTRRFGKRLAVDNVSFEVERGEGAFVVTITTLILMAVGMAVAWGLLVMLSVALFDRENILTRWR